MTRPLHNGASVGAWPVFRLCGLATALLIIGAAVIRPAIGLTVFWGGFVGALPLLLLAAPGFWRNVCPMATLNQLAHRTGWNRGRRMYPRAQARVQSASAVLFVMLVLARPLLLDKSGVSLACFLGAALLASFIGGLIFVGKSGWCSQLCPMGQVERFYGQSPLVVIQDTHCGACTGCAKQCYDLAPTMTVLRDLTSDRRWRSRARTHFAGMMPGLCVAFFTTPTMTTLSIAAVLAASGRTAACVVAGIAAYSALERSGISTPYQALVGVVAGTVALYYWFVMPTLLGLFGGPHLWLLWPARGSVLALILVWLRLALLRERAFRVRHLQRSAA